MVERLIGFAVVVGQHLQVQLWNFDFSLSLTAEGRCVRTAVDRVGNVPLVQRSLLSVVDASRYVSQAPLGFMFGFMTLANEVGSRLGVSALVLFFFFFFVNSLFKILSRVIVTEFYC